MSNSQLINYTRLSPFYSIRDHVIDTITIHCMAGNLSIETCGDLFSAPSTRASSNYGIGSDGRIALYVAENNRSWCTSSYENDRRAVTIEVANDGGKNTGWHVSDAAYRSLIDLVADICKRNNIKELKWRADKSLIGQIDKQNMTVHRWFDNKECPGDYLYNLHYDIMTEVNERLNPKVENKKDNTPDAWAKEAVDFAVKNDILFGDEHGNYKLHNNCTRQEMLVFIHRLYKLMNK